MNLLEFVGISLFLCGIGGLIISRGSLIRVLMCLELLLLSISLLVINFSLWGDSVEGVVIFLVILIVVGAESSLSLGILILYYRIRGIVGVRELSMLRG